MTKDEIALLGNVLDSLDRLFDHESTVIDVYALLFATSKALANSSFYPHLEPVVARLRAIARTHESAESRRHEALVVTDELRKTISQSLPRPTI